MRFSYERGKKNIGLEEKNPTESREREFEKNLSLKEFEREKENIEWEKKTYSREREFTLIE